MFLCDRRLHKTGEIFPVTELRIKTTLNGADELFFRTPRHVQNYNAKDLESLNRSAVQPIEDGINRCYDLIKDYSVVLVRGFGYFEVLASISDAETELKTVTGKSLGESELSQILCTLECNTETDIARTDYSPSVLYNESDPDSSLLNRILSYAPNYTVGHVDDTVKSIQRVFSFSKTDILSCFSQIAEETGCIFDISVTKDEEDGTVMRRVDVYDAQYCGNCGKRNIANGKCRDCGSTDIRGIGEDTTIQISTDSLSDEITLSSDGNMKNCFIVEGGDDLMTNTVSGISPSGSNKIYMFSEETKNSFSDELRAKYERYAEDYDAAKPEYEKIFETECSIFDLILYLQSGRMPSPETSGRDLHEEVFHVLSKYMDTFPGGLGTTESDNNSSTASKNSMIRQIFSLFVDNGYAVRLENGAYNGNNWAGDLIIYDVQNSDSKAVIQVGDNKSTVSFSDSGTETSGELKRLLDSFKISFLKDNYENYVRQHVALAVKNYEYIEDQRMNNPKEWQRYSLNRLSSYRDGYETCKQTLNELKNSSSLPGVKSTSEKLIEKYNDQIENIDDYMIKLEDIIHFLYLYYGSFGDDSSDAPSSQDMDYSADPKIFKAYGTAFSNMVHYIKYGTWEAGDESVLTDDPLYCSGCGSTNVTVNGCNNCSGTVVTYSDIAQSVYDHYNMHVGTNIKTQKETIHNSLDMEKYLGSELYRELCSHIREDVYMNSNFISDGLQNNNTKLVSTAKELVQKAEEELEKACVPQHTLSGNIYEFAAFSTLDRKDFPIPNAYDGFKLGNFMRYIPSDGTVYRLRLASEEFSWGASGVQLDVEFTDVLRYPGNRISDISTLVSRVGSLSTSFDSVKKQAERGEDSYREFEAVKSEGLKNALGNVLDARNQEVQITDQGILLRKQDYDNGGYDDHQMRMINRSIVMTDNGWKTAKLAVGLGQYNNEPKYGVWADLLVGDIILGKRVVISDREDREQSSVLIDGNGIKITGTDENKNPSVTVELNPQKNDILKISKNNGDSILYVDKEGNAKFSGNIDAKGLLTLEIDSEKGSIGGWEFDENSIYSNEKTLSSLGKINFKLIPENGIHAETENKDYGNTTFNGYEWVQSAENRTNYMYVDYYGFHVLTKEDGKFLMTSGQSGSTTRLDGVSITTGEMRASQIHGDSIRVREEVNAGRLYERDVPISESYGVVSTGENELTGKSGAWEMMTADFGRTYDAEPFVNVMFCGTQPSSENIVFDGYIGDSENGYTGFRYYVRTATDGYNYKTKWWAVGNIKLNRYEAEKK